MTLQHVIIGAGPAAINAIETIRQCESSRSQITLISDEPAHARMALPYFLAGTIPRERTHTADKSYLDRLGVTAHVGIRANRIFADRQTVGLADGTELRYDTLLIATGSTPLRPAIDGADLPGVQHMWSLNDVASALDTTAHMATPRVVLIGGGFVGLIVLGALFKRHWQLTVIERESHVLPYMLDQEAAAIVASWLTARDVAVRTGVAVTAIRVTQAVKRIHLSDGSDMTADLVLLATGVKPNLELVCDTRIATDVGILVNDRMQTCVPNIYAAGDVAQGPVLFSDESAVHAIQPTAVDHGRVAGANMAGQNARYPGSLSMNILDVCGLQCVSYGCFDASDTEGTTIVNANHSIYRKLAWREDQLVGAIFTGCANDAGMLSDIGMTKGILQTQAKMGIWKQYLLDNPFDIRRPFVALGIASRLAGTTLLGQPAQMRAHRAGAAELSRSPNRCHTLFLDTKTTS